MDKPEAAQQDVVAFLSDPATYGGGTVETVTTHISRIFLTADRAYKLKRAIRLPFLDYSSLAARKAACDHEVMLNRRTAPALYRGVIAVTQAADGRLVLGGNGPAVDWLVEMTRFPKEAEADHMARAGRFTATHATALADSIAAFHAGLAPDRTHGGAAALRQAIRDLAATLANAAPDLASRGQALADRLLARVDHQAARLDARRDGGHVRLCHGDLHLGNIVVLDGRPLPFDGIEFSDAIATIDVLYDLAFTVMDLVAHDLPALANLVLNRYLAATRDYGGLDLLPLYLGTRALVRVMAEAMAGHHDRARRYAAIGDAVLAPCAPRVIAVGGLSGSGKSSVARALAPEIAPPPGAILLRSDEIRKRLMAVAPEVTLPEGAYAPDVTRAVFERMAEDARACLEAGCTVILDATHMAPAARARAEAIARDRGVPFQGLWLEAPADVLEARVGSRQHDASDATVAVLRNQTKADLGAIGWTILDASGDLAAVTAAARDALGLRGT